MTLELIVIAVFLAAMVFIAVMYRKATLDKLPLLPGEETIFEETVRRVEQGGTRRQTVFPKCLVRVTTRRIVIAQKFAFNKSRYALRHVITYDRYSDTTDLGSTLKKGYIIMDINKSDLETIQEYDRQIIRIHIPESLLTKDQYIEFTTEKAEKYEKIFR